MVVNRSKTVPARAAVTALAAAVLAALLPVLPARAQVPPVWQPPAPQEQRSVPGTPVHAVRPPADAANGRAWQAPAVTWPAAGEATVDLDPAGGSPDGGRAGLIQAAGLPVRVGAPDGASADGVPRRVRVEVLDRSAAERAGVDGVLLRVTRADGVEESGALSLAVDYSGFAYAYGGDWAARLRLVALPACVLTTPTAPRCSRSAAVPSHNDLPARTVTARIAARPDASPGGPISAQTEATVYALAAAVSGSTGDYAATSLSPSATWDVGESTGAFSWAYPVRVPPAPGARVPDVSLSYSSAGIDGRTASTNNQTSWVGEGFDGLANYVERKYKPCLDDGVSHKPGDLCWGYDNATLMLNGSATELVRDDATGQWRPRNDNGARIEKLTGTTNGDNNGEYWRVTTTDGTQYHFGLNRAPDWASGSPVTASTWTVPVFGDDSGEPCHASTFDASWCQQAWRWNLDYVVDTHGNAVTYWYARETNYYSRNLDTSKATSYHRGGYLTRIDYGLRSDSVLSTPPTARVVLSTAERCLPTATFDCAESKFTSANASYWPDVPFDRYCAAGQTCSDDFTPTFWSRKRLVKITTQVRAGTGYSDVDTWDLEHQFPAPGDGTSPALWLWKITHTGKVGGSQAVPAVVFSGIQKQNRVDAKEGLPPLYKLRISAVDNETGGALSVQYSDPECVAGSLPAPAANTKRCFPQKWTPPDLTEVDDWFHKYVVTSIAEADRTGGAPPVQTEYRYLDGAAWHYDDDDGLTKEKDKSWSQWRGYARVHVVRGAADGPRSMTEYRYFRGMDGDRQADGSKKDVKVTDSDGNAHDDHEALSGFELEEIRFNGTGTEVVERTVSTAWYRATGKRTRSWGTTSAYLVATGTARSRVAVTGGGWRVTEVRNTFNDDGLNIQVDDLGDTSTAADDQCTRTTYLRNTTAWLIRFPSRVETVSKGCTATTNRPDDVVEDVRTSYDQKAYGQVPDRGDPTRVEKIAAYSNGTAVYVTESTAVYDGYGRVTEERDAAGNLTATAYTPATGGPVTRTTETNALGHVTVTEFAAEWGVIAATVDANGKRTDLAYDPLGRLTKVWLANRAKATQSPNKEFGYLVRTDGASAVWSRTLRNDGSYLTDYQLFDGLLRPRQSQSPAPGGGRTLADTFYDSRGLIVKSNHAYYNAEAPGTTLFTPASDGDVPGQTVTVYDGADRPTAIIFLVRGQEKWRSSTTYGGDRVYVNPPPGGIATTTLTDARGRHTEMWQHKSPGSAEVDVTRYTYAKGDQLATVTDPAGNRWTYDYDLRGRQIRTDDPDKGTTTYGYNDLDELVSIQDARGTTLVLTYDAAGRKTGMYEGSTSGPKRAAWTYDTLAKGLPTAAIRYVGADAYVNEITGYDDLYRVTGARLTVPAVEPGLAGTYQTSAEYNLDGTLARSAVPGAGGLPAETMLYGYNELGMPTTTRGLTTYVTHTAYTKLGQPQQMVYSSGGKRLFLDIRYEDGTERLSTVTVDRETSPNRVSQVNYRYDPAGNVTAIAETGASGEPGDTQCFRHDYLGRLTEAWTATDDCVGDPRVEAIGGAAPYWTSLNYEVTGNRTREVQHGLGGAQDVTRDYAYPVAGGAQPHALRSVTTSGPGGTSLDSYGYDAAGNTTGRDRAGEGQTLEWDAEGRLAKVTNETGAVSTFLYDADGNRLIRRDPDADTLFVGDMEVRRDKATGQKSATRYYTHDGEVVAARSTAGLTWLVNDHHDTATTAVADTATQQVSRRRFTPFGQQRGAQPATWPGERGFVGGTVDSATGLTHLGAREYDPDLGRFMSVDPVIDTGDPQQMNGYAYANNSPATSSDPDGLCPADRCGYGSPRGDGHGVHKYGPIDPGDRSAGYVDTDGSVRYRGKTYRSYKSFYRANYGGSARVRAQRIEYQRRLAQLAAAKRRAEEQKQKLIAAAKGITKILADELGITAGIDCFTKGDLAACGETAVNLLSSLIGGVAGRFLSKYGAPWKWAKAKRLVSTLWSLGKLLASGFKGWLKARGEVRAAERALSACRTNSFVPGTKVRLADGSAKPIEQVKVGDTVLATDPRTGVTAAKPVVATIIGVGRKNLVQVTVDTDGPRGAGTATVVATDKHPFWVSDRRAWLNADQLQPGMWLRTGAGTAVQVEAVRSFAAQQRVHNLTVDDIHTYYVLVGGQDALVHNCGGVVPSGGNGGGRSRIRNGLQRVRQLPYRMGDVSEGMQSGYRASEWFSNNLGRAGVLLPGDYDGAVSSGMRGAFFVGGFIRGYLRNRPPRGTGPSGGS